MSASVCIAIAGATGAVGQEILALLEERAPEGSELRLLASARSAGREMSFRGRRIVVEELSETSFAGVDVAFFSCGGERSRRFAPCATEAGAIVIDNSSAFRLDEGVPLVVPEVNAAALRDPSGRVHPVIANPNCSTILLVLALAPLHARFGLQRVLVSTYQAASGAGQRAMDALVDATRAALEPEATVEDPSADYFGRGLAFNLVPKIDVWMDEGRTREEHKMLHESRKILGCPELRLEATCVRVPILRCHAESVSIETLRSVSVEEAREVLGSAPGIRLLDGPEAYPMPSSAEGGGPVEVGRLRPSAVFDSGLSFFLCGDQLLKGAALNAVQIFESLSPPFPLPRLSAGHGSQVGGGGSV